MNKLFCTIVLVILLLLVFGCLKNSQNNQNVNDSVSSDDANILNTIVNDQVYSINQNGLVRKYKLHFPVSYDFSESLPLVIYLHGGGGNLDSAYQDGIDKYSDKYNFILAIPQGAYSDKDESYAWNGGAWVGGECCGGADDVGFVGVVD